MASGHVNRVNRPNTWLHRPSLRREVFPCQLGAVHTWHTASLVGCQLSVRRDHGAESAPGSARPSQRDDVAGGAPPLGHGEHVGCPGVERGALLRRPVVTLIDPGDAGAAAADVIQHRFLLGAGPLPLVEGQIGVGASQVLPRTQQCTRRESVEHLNSC